MPRRSSSTPAAGKTPPKAESKTPPKESRVTSNSAQKELSDVEIGYVFQFPTPAKDTPLDYAFDTKSGKTKTGQIPWGVKLHDFRDGISGANIPCLAAWKAGRWLSEFALMDAPIFDIIAEGKTPPKGWEFDIWVVTGSGMPGAFWFHHYLLPREIAVACVAKDDIPKHPVMWRPALKSGNAKKFEAQVDPFWEKSPQGFAPRFFAAAMTLLRTGELPTGQSNALKAALKQIEEGRGWKPDEQGSLLPGKAATVTKLPKPTAPALPAGVRFRHACGHWFKESDLAGHAKVCPAEGGEGFADWAVMCDDKCGCEMLEGFPSAAHKVGYKTLDHIAMCKPGYPRAAEEVTVTETVEAPAEPETAETEESGTAPESEESSES